MVPCPQTPPVAARFGINIQGSPKAVRTVLADLRAWLEAAGVTPDACGTVEIALAEALNNIVEHAYAPAQEGPLRLEALLRSGLLEIELADDGAPLPGLNLPEKCLPDNTGPIEALPEGGFGWFLIHGLTETLSYRREGMENRLRMQFAVNPGDA